MLRVSRKMTDAIFDHAYEGYPLEVCGILGGENGVVTTLFRMTNSDPSHAHFVMDPKEQFAVMDKMRGAGLEMLAVYHSHPDGPSRPSAEDIRLAFSPDISYVIISLKKLDNPVLKSYRITTDHAELENVEYL